MALDIGSLVGYLELDTDKFDTDLDGAGGKLRGAGAKFAPLANAAGLAAGAALGAGLLNAINVEDSQAKLSAQLGATGPEAARFGKVAGQVYSNNFGGSLSEVNDAIASVVQNISGMRNASAPQLKAVSQQVLSVADTFDQDLGGVTKAVGTLMKTGLAKNASEALDIITKGMQNGANKADDLLDTFNEYSTQFRKVGLDGKTAMGLIQQGLQGGARDADLVADAIKEFSIRAVDGSKTTAQGFKALGLDGEKMAARIGKGGKSASKALDTTLDRLRGIKDPVKRAQVATQLFGTQAEDLGAALFKLDPSKATQAMGKTAGAAKKLGDTMGNTTAAKLETFKRAATTAFTQMAANALPVLNPVLATLTKYAPVLSKVAVGMAALLAVVKVGQGISAAATAVKAFVGAAKLASAASKVWAAVQWILNVAMTANPIGIIIVAVAALIAIIVLIATKTTWFQTIWKVVWGGIKAAALAVAAWFMSTIVPFFTKTIPAALRKLASLAKSIWSGIASVGKAIWGGIVAVVKGYINAYRTVITTVFKAVAKIISTVWKGIQTAAKAVWAAIVAVVKAHVNGVKAAINGIKAIVARIRAFFQQAKDAAVSRLVSLVSYVRGIPGRIKSALGNVGRLLYQAGKNVISGLINGIKSMVGKVASAISSVTKKIRDHLPFSPAKEGPLSGSGNPRISGRKIAEMLAQGMGDKAGVVTKSADRLVGGINPAPRPMRGDGAAAVPFGAAGGRGALVHAEKIELVRGDANDVADRLLFAARARGF